MTDVRVSSDAVQRMQMNDIDGAIQSLKLAIDQNPNFPEAHLKLAEIYRKNLSDAESADAHLFCFRDVLVPSRG